MSTHPLTFFNSLSSLQASIARLFWYRRGVCRGLTCWTFGGMSNTAGPISSSWTPMLSCYNLPCWIEQIKSLMYRVLPGLQGVPLWGADRRQRAAVLRRRLLSPLGAQQKYGPPSLKRTIFASFCSSAYAALSCDVLCSHVQSTPSTVLRNEDEDLR